MQLIKVHSTAIREVGYDGDTLVVIFHHGGCYDHPGVPPSVYRDFMQASSKGSYYARRIRGRYR
jgi:hypothetical protein